MNVWDNLLVAIVGGAVALGGGELIRYLNDRRTRKNLVADWKIRALPTVPGIRGRIFYIENTGEADAFDVQFTITGDAKFDIHPDAGLERRRKTEGFMVDVTNAGTGVARIGWRDENGKRHGPIDRALVTGLQ